MIIKKRWLISWMLVAVVSIIIAGCTDTASSSNTATATTGTTSPTPIQASAVPAPTITADMANRTYNCIAKRTADSYGLTITCPRSLIAAINAPGRTLYVVENNTINHYRCHTRRGKALPSGAFLRGGDCGNSWQMVVRSSSREADPDMVFLVKGTQLANIQATNTEVVSVSNGVFQ